MAQGHISLSPSHSAFCNAPRRRAAKWTVKEGLSNQSWILDIQGALTVGAIAKFLSAWDLMGSVQLRPKIADNHFSCLPSNGKHSAKASVKCLGTQRRRTATTQLVASSCPHREVYPSVGGLTRIGEEIR
jgi:hypothetical protein